MYYFKEGTYELATGKAAYTVTELPFVLDKMAKLLKVKIAEPLFFLNIFFGASLLYFVVSSICMFIPSTSDFKKGMPFAAIGAVLTLVLLFI